MKDEFAQKMVDSKFGRYILKVPDNIALKMSFSQPGSSCKRARILMIIIDECAECMLKKINEIAHLNYSKGISSKLMFTTINKIGLRHI